jgi:hypothetical protein
MRQYAASPVIQQLVADRATYFPSAWQDEFYNNYWNIDTATGLGLDYWGRIVVVDRTVQVEFIDTNFGFHEAWTGASPGYTQPGPVIINNLAFVLLATNPTSTDDRIQPFDQAPFYDGLVSTQTVTLADSAYRTLILAKALANISDCTTKSLNRILRLLFGQGGRRCYVQTNNQMGMSYVFEFQLSPVEKTIALQSGIMPRPAGVKLSIVQIDPDGTFGFAEGEFQPFDQGTFLGDDGVINAI